MVQNGTNSPPPESLDPNVPWKRENLKIEYLRAKDDLENAKRYIQDLESKSKNLETRAKQTEDRKTDAELLVTGLKKEVERLYEELEVLRKRSPESNNATPLTGPVSTSAIQTASVGAIAGSSGSPASGAEPTALTLPPRKLSTSADLEREISEPVPPAIKGT